MDNHQGNQSGDPPVTNHSQVPSNNIQDVTKTNQLPSLPAHDVTNDNTTKQEATEEDRSEGFYSQETLNEDVADPPDGVPDSPRDWKSVDEPEFEYDDETGLDLEAQDALESDEASDAEEEATDSEGDEGISDKYLHNSHAYLSFMSGPVKEVAHDDPEPPFLQTSHFDESCDQAEGSGPECVRSLTPDGLIDGLDDEDFEDQLGSPANDDDNDPESPYKDIARYGIIQVAGDDTYGRKVIVFSACKLPNRTELDTVDPHGRLLQYLKHTLDQYVENDYTLVYFHHGLNHLNKPSFAWMRGAYSDFDRKYKKNLKALYLVHPSRFIKIMWNIFRPLISVKFGRKLTYVNYLHELAQYIQLDQLNIPQKVKDHDAFLLAKNKPQPVPTSIVHAPVPTQQFGVEIQFIKEHNNGDPVPPVVKQCITYLRDNALEVEGIFRRSANAATLKNVQKQFNAGIQVDFAQLLDIHIPAALLKSFLRQLPEPVLTYDLYDHIIRVQGLDGKERLLEMRRLLSDELPDDNYFVLKYVIQFLTEVADHCDSNKMTEQNLAIVFGPNLLWSKSQASLTALGYVNTCAQLLISQYHTLFVK